MFRMLSAARERSCHEHRHAGAVFPHAVFQGTSVSFHLIVFRRFKGQPKNAICVYSWAHVVPSFSTLVPVRRLQSADGRRHRRHRRAHPQRSSELPRVLHCDQGWVRVGMCKVSDGCEGLTRCYGHILGSKVLISRLTKHMDICDIISALKQWKQNRIE